MRPRRKTQQMAGRHADPVDQADAILWAEDVRIRARWLLDEMDRRLATPADTDNVLDYCRFVMDWSGRCTDLLLEVIGRG